MTVSTLDPDDHIIIISMTLVTSENYFDWAYTLNNLVQYGTPEFVQWFTQKAMLMMADMSPSIKGAKDDIVPLAGLK